MYIFLCQFLKLCLNIDLFPLIFTYISIKVFIILAFPSSSAGKQPSCNAGDTGSIPGFRRSTGEGIGYPLQYSWASLMAQLVKNPVQWGRSRNPCVRKIPWRREPPPTPVFWPGEFHGLYSPRGRKELETTEWLSLHFIYNITLILCF